MSTTGIILAAGRSRRFHSARPRVLHELCGKPMLRHVLETCYEAGCWRVLAVVGPGRDQVQAAFAGERRIEWVEQPEPLGSGHAVLLCEPRLRGHNGEVMILAGDRPLLRAEAVRALSEARRRERAAAAVSTAVLDDPGGHDRVVRDESGRFVEIVDHLDVTSKHQAVTEISPDCYCLRLQDLQEAMPKLRNRTRKGGYRLSDLFAILQGHAKKVVAVQVVSPEEAIGVNSRQQLAEADAIMQERIHRRLRECGVTIVNSETTYIEAGAAVGSDTVIRPFTYIGRDASIGPGCVLGPFAMIPQDALVPEGTSLAGNVTPGNALMENDRLG